ncbi:MAG: calcium/sodium antiporter [bacterium]|nr:calcium/sodium antiporter [bacterium]
MLLNTMVLLLLLGVAVGVAILVKAADWFTEAAVEVARRFRIPEMIVGATIVSLATTLPEFAVSFTATLQGQVDITIGNAVGSTICNIGLILGLCAVLSPMAVARDGFFASCLGLLVLAGIFGALGYVFPDGSRIVGVVMVSCLIVYLAATVRSSLKNRVEASSEHEPGMSVLRICVLFIVGAVGVVGGSRLMVECGVRLAELAGIPQLIIGLTVLAIGTSTPELVVSLTAIVKKRRGLSIGNIIGANVLNLAWVIGSCSLVRPLPVQFQTRVLDIPGMVLLTALLFVFGLSSQRLSRWEGAVLLGGYVTYLAVMFMFFAGA